jgi:hypothetical protein
MCWESALRRATKRLCRASAVQDVLSAAVDADFRRVKQRTADVDQLACSLRLKEGQHVNYRILPVTVVVVGVSSKVGVDYSSAMNDMDMREQADTGEVAAEKRKQEACQVCSHCLHSDFGPQR